MEETHNTLKFASRAKRVEIYASRNKVCLFIMSLKNRTCLRFLDEDVLKFTLYTCFLQIIDEKSLIKKYQREISCLKHELDQLRRGMLVGVSQEEILSLRQQVYCEVSEFGFSEVLKLYLLVIWLCFSIVWCVFFIVGRRTSENAIQTGGRGGSQGCSTQ